MNYITGEPAFSELWEDVLDEKHRRRVLSEWRVFSDWVDRKSGENNSLDHSTIDRKMVSLMDRLLKRVKVPQPLLILFYLASSISPLERTEASDRVHVRIIDTHAVLSLFKECAFYQNHLSEPGYNGPPRNLWERKNNLNSAKKRADWSKQELHIRGLF